MDDSLLVERILAQRDEAAFRMLVERHADAVLRLSSSLLKDRQSAEDATQETFVVVSRKLRSFDRQRSLRAWILGIAYRRALKLSGRRREEAREMPELEDRHEPHEDASRKEAAALLAQELARLSTPHRALLQLHYEEGLSYAEAAATLHIAEGTAKSRVGRALKQLREALGRRGVLFTSALLLQTPRLQAGPALIQRCVEQGVTGLVAGTSTFKLALLAALLITAGTIVAVSATRESAPERVTREFAVNHDPVLGNRASDEAGMRGAAAASADAGAVGTDPVDADAADPKRGPVVMVNGERVALQDLLKNDKRLRVGPDGRIHRGPIPRVRGSGKGVAPPMGAPGHLDENGKWVWPATPKFASPPRHFGRVTIRGRVLDSAGTPIPGAKIWRIAEDASREETTAISGRYMDKLATSGAGGDFVLKNQKAGTMLLFADYQGRMNVPEVGKETAHAVSVVARPGAAVDGVVLRVPIVLNDFGTLAGRVVDREGLPIPHATVWIATTLRRFTRADGKFDLGSLPAGKHTLRVEQPGYEEQTLEVQVEPRTRRTVDVTMDLLQAGSLRLAGLVLDQAGHPVSGVRLFLGAGSGTVREQVTNDNGEYAFDSLPDELAELSVSVSLWPRSGYLPGNFKDVALPQDAFEMRVKKTVELFVRVTSAVSGEPIPQINYKILVPVERDGETVMHPRQTGRRFSVDGTLDDIHVAIGEEATLFVEVPGHEAWERELDTDTDEARIELDLALDPAPPEPENQRPEGTDDS